MRRKRRDSEMRIHFFFGRVVVRSKICHNSMAVYSSLLSILFSFLEFLERNK